MGYSADKSPLIGHLAGPIRRLKPLGAQRQEKCGPNHLTREGLHATTPLIDVEPHRAVFTWVQQRLAAAGLLQGRTIAIDATTLEANAAMRSIVRRDTGEDYQAYLTRLAAASGIKTPTREVVARFDRKRKKKTSNKDWTSLSDPDAKVAKMKDGRTHLAHKAEHAVDLESGALIAVTVQGADQGDTTTIVTTAITAAEQVEAAHVTTAVLGMVEAIVADKGYHSNETLVDLAAVGVRSYLSEPDRGRRDWSDAPDAQAPVYRNRRRIRGARGGRLRRRRAELAERSFAHLYETGGMRRTHLRGHDNILKRLLIHAGGFKRKRNSRRERYHLCGNIRWTTISRFDRPTRAFGHVGRHGRQNIAVARLFRGSMRNCSACTRRCESKAPSRALRAARLSAA